MTLRISWASCLQAENEIVLLIRYYSWLFLCRRARLPIAEWETWILSSATPQRGANANDSNTKLARWPRAIFVFEADSPWPQLSAPLDIAIYRRTI